ncbi:MAG: uncharacterized protein QOG68_317 [Solirubrobacteraceae bacterium]|jgi:ketosteroid isomerase-like protein|nr:uncharacterized protein [Solirubrobacteraceae bacterium]
MSAFEYGRPSTADRAVQVVRGIYDAFARRDLDAVLAFVAEDAELHLTGTASRIGRTEPYRGHAGLREYFADAARVWDDLTLHAEDIRAAGHGVVVFGHAEGSIDGQPVRRSAVWVWQLRDDLAVSVRVTDLGGNER